MTAPLDSADRRALPDPYYQDDTVTIYHGDCRELLPALAADVLVTDPPYGVEIGTGDRRRGTGRLFRDGYETYNDTYENYLAVVVPVVAQLVAMTERAAVWVGPHYHELPKADAIGGIYSPAATGRNRWGFKTFLPVLLYGTRPNANMGSYPIAILSQAHREDCGHPMPKPLSWLRWLVGLVSLPGETIIDPFAGSGTTLRAAKDLNRRSIGIEIEERYCEIAARACAQEVIAA